MSERPSLPKIFIKSQSLLHTRQGHMGKAHTLPKYEFTISGKGRKEKNDKSERRSKNAFHRRYHR